MDSTDKRKLRAKAHSLKPVVMIGQSGLTPAVLTEIESALAAHELIKIKIRAERELRKQIGLQICLDTKAELIQTIGQITIIYRHNPDK
ncbi:MAG: YhbY family RNA-binding protein [Methylococcales bacterium]|nr:YhbY family RNA-binding protein [Methylococcales bacterium]